MGGAKKRTIAQMEKAQNVQEEKSGAKKKGKQSFEKKTSSGAVSKLDEKMVLSELAKMKAITPPAVASQLGVRVGAAKEYLRELANRGMISVVGGSSRVKIYTIAAA